MEYAWSTHGYALFLFWSDVSLYGNEKIVLGLVVFNEFSHYFRRKGPQMPQYGKEAANRIGVVWSSNRFVWI